MELSFFPILFSFLFLLLVIPKQKKSRNQLIQNFPLPPGPWKLPIIGSMHHIIGTLPHRSFRDLSIKYGPVMHLKLGEIDHIIISSPEAAKEILKTKDLNFASRPENYSTKITNYGPSDIAFSPYGDYWKQLRKIAALELFSVKRVKTFSSIREEEVLSLIQRIFSSSSSSGRGGSPVNLTKLFLLLTNKITSRATYGEKCKHEERFISAVLEVNKFAIGFNVVDLYPSVKFLDVVSGMKFKVNRIHHEIDGILDEIIGEHPARSRELQGEKESLLDVLLRTKEHGDLDIPLTMNNVKAMLMVIFTAGTETTANVMTWAMAELMRNPVVKEKAQAEVRLVLGAAGKENIEHNLDKLNYLKLEIKETLRLHSPIPLLLPRVCAETCEVAGYTIPARSTVLINAWAMGRDPKYWHDAESFKPERFDNADQNFDASSRGTTTGFEYLPFGGGRRICPGITFGLAIVELVLAQLLYHFDWELPGGMQPQDLDMTEDFGLAVERKLDLLLLAKPHVINVGEEKLLYGPDSTRDNGEW